MPAHIHSPTLLTLPPEILAHILDHLLPHTVQLRRSSGGTRAKRRPFHDLVWTNRHHRTAIPLLLTCKRLSDFCSERIYGPRNQFVLRTSYEGSVWVFRRLLDLKGLVPTETRRLEDCFGGGGGSSSSGLEDLNALGNRHVWTRVRRWCIEVTIEDGYTNEIITPTPRSLNKGMIKYGFGQSGLDHGVREQMARVVGLLKQCDELVAVHVWLDDQERDVAAAERVLEPLLDLEGRVPGGVVLENARPEFAARIAAVTSRP